MSIPESEWIGKVDMHGREILFVREIKTRSFYVAKLAVIMNARGYLELMIIGDVVSVICQDKPAIIFQGVRRVAFTLKGGGKIYFGNSEATSYVRYKMDYDSSGNMWTRQINYDTVEKPVLFLSSFWVFIIRRRIRQKKERRKVGT